MTQLKTSGKNGILLEEYNGEYGLTATYEGKDGKDWAQWGKAKISKDSYSDKDRPIKVVLGDKATAIDCLTKIINALNNEDVDDISF
jgi:hypothetical protein